MWVQCRWVKCVGKVWGCQKVGETVRKSGSQSESGTDCQKV